VPHLEDMSHICERLLSLVPYLEDMSHICERLPGLGLHLSNHHGWVLQGLALLPRDVQPSSSLGYQTYGIKTKERIMDEVFNVFCVV